MEAGEEPPRYITWDGQLQAAFEAVKMLLDQFYANSNTSAAAFGKLIAGTAQSAAAIRRLLYAPLTKAGRIRNEYDSDLKGLFRAAGILANGKALKIRIEWQDGLPTDPTEAANAESVALGAGLTTRRDALARLWGLTGEELDEMANALERAVAKESAKERPSGKQSDPKEKQDSN
jgi:hypothetical protein